MTPLDLDLDAIRVRANARLDYADERPESLHVHEDYAALADESAADVLGLVEEVERLRSESQQFYENRNLWQKRAEKAEAERDEARAEVARLTTRPAWDEEAVRAASQALYERLTRIPEFARLDSHVQSDYSNTLAHAVLAVIRDHLPVKPGREDMVEAMLGSDIITDDLRAEASAQGSTQREPFLCFADAVLALWPGESRATVQAEALRDAADEAEAVDADALVAGCAAPVSGERGRQSVIDAARAMCEEPWTWLRARADRLAAEGGADRG